MNLSKKEPDISTVRCQKCLQKGHWTYQCTNERKTLMRPSRTTQMKRQIKHMQNRNIEVATKKEILRTSEAEPNQQPSNETCDSESDSDSSSSENSSKSSSSSRSSTSSTSSTSSSDSSSSSSDTNSSSSS